MPLTRTSFKKGVVTNPNGRPPKGYSITDMFKSMLSAKPEVKEAIQNAILKKALQGDTTAQKLIWGYMDGMPKQEHEHTGEDGGTIDHTLTVRFVDPPSAK